MGQLCPNSQILSSQSFAMARHEVAGEMCSPEMSHILEEVSCGGQGRE